MHAAAFFSRWSFCPAAVALATCAGMADEPEAVKFADPALPEASGMAVSPSDPSFLWLINDSGCPATIHLADRSGRARGVVRLAGARNIDWEDLAAFRWKGRSWLLVADVGDNEAVRKGGGSLYFVPEPEMPRNGDLLDVAPETIGRVEFRYPDGPRDCEAVAVDVPGGSIFLLSKRDKKPRLYRLPLERPGGGGMETAEFLGETLVPPVPEGMPFHPYGKQPTAMDFSRDGRTAAVLTYQGVFVIRRGEKESWSEAFARPWETVGSHRLTQAEAIAFEPDGKAILVTSEGVGAPLLKFP